MKRLNRILPAIVFLFFAVSSHVQSAASDGMPGVIKDQTDENRINTLINLSRQYYTVRDTLAIGTASEVLKLLETMDYQEGVGKSIHFPGQSWANIEPDTAMAELLSTIGFLYNNIQNYEEAHQWQRKALEMPGNTEQPILRGLILGRIGINYNDLGEYDSALYYNNLAIEYFRKAGDDFYVAQWMSNLANTYLKMNNNAEAERLLSEALKLNTFDDQKPNIYNNLAKVYLETGRYQLSRMALDNAFYFSEKFQRQDLISDAWFRTYELNKATGKISQALQAYIKYAELRISVLNKTKTVQLAQMITRFETESKQKALLVEKAEKNRVVKEKIEAELSASRTRRWFLWVLLSLVILAHVGLVIYLRMKRKALNDKNQAIIKEQERGLSAIIQAQENERKKIAKDLHDGVGRQISAISMNFQAFARKIAKDIPDHGNDIEKIKCMILDTSEEIRSISHQMMPRALTQFGLVDAMEDIVEISFKNSDIQVEFSVSNMEERLPQEVETGIYRIAQELISNVIKHSGSSSVFIELSRIDNTGVLTVQDDGIGIKQSDNKGIGITNITSRVNALNGSFTIEAMPVKGSLATIKIPI